MCPALLVGKISIRRRRRDITIGRQFGRDYPRNSVQERGLGEGPRLQQVRGSGRKRATRRWAVRNRPHSAQSTLRLWLEEGRVLSATAAVFAVPTFASLGDLPRHSRSTADQ
jgi:hypothetical protein